MARFIDTDWATTRPINRVVVVCYPAKYFRSEMEKIRVSGKSYMQIISSCDARTFLAWDVVTLGTPVFTWPEHARRSLEEAERRVKISRLLCFGEQRRRVDAKGLDKF